MDFHPRAAGASNRPFLCAKAADMSRMAHVRRAMSRFGANLPEIGAIFREVPANALNSNDVLQQSSAFFS
jgi:ABC-type enterobactin transport system permease subunit